MYIYICVCVCVHVACRFEKRLEGLLNSFWRTFCKDGIVVDESLNRFFVMGGECNYLLRPTLSENGDRVELEFIDEKEWQTEEMKAWTEEDISELLSNAKVRSQLWRRKTQMITKNLTEHSLWSMSQAALEEACNRVRLAYTLIQKPRAVGIVPKLSTTYEHLEEVALSVQAHLVDSKIPFCAFNGGGTLRIAFTRTPTM